MDRALETIEKIDSILFDKLKSYLQKDKDGNWVIIDPIDKRLVSSDYAQSHCAVAFLYSNENEGIQVGISMIRALLGSWSQDILIPSFHFDFNNFALCIGEQRLCELGIEPQLREQIRLMVIGTQDSLHDTVNWLPMRYYVNLKRAEWTGNEMYLTKAEDIKQQINNATWEDGFIDDRSNKGISFNLQYDLSTVSLMSFINNKSGTICFDIEKHLFALIQMVLPDGDINYLGRGCNQIFAWGPWIYLLWSAGQYQILNEACVFLSKKIIHTIENNNLMLNEKQGNEKYLWWDYHYASVYLAHLLMWLRLACKLPEREDKSCERLTTFGEDSGVRKLSFSKSGVVTFSGRRCYMAEYGPVISAVYTDRVGVIYKGGFAPWKGMFGNRYTHNLPVIHNFFGLLNVKENSRLSDNRLFRRFNIYPSHTVSVSLKPLFLPVEAKEDEHYLEVVFFNKCKKNAQLNLPILPECNMSNIHIEVSADENHLPIIQTGAIYNQYGMCRLYQTQPCKAKVWKVKIRL